MHINNCFSAFDHTGFYYKSVGDKVSLAECIQWVRRSGEVDCIHSSVTRVTDGTITVLHDCLISDNVERTLQFHGWQESRVKRIARIIES